MVALTGETVRVVVAQTLGYSLELQDTKKAAVLDPGNERYLYALGMIALSEATDESRQSAVASLQTATKLNPNWASAWSGLAKACFGASDKACQTEAVQTSLSLAPANPEYLWNAALYDVMDGDWQAATSRLKKYLGMRPDRELDAYRLLLSGSADPQLVWTGLLGRADARQRVQYLGFLVQAGQPDAAYRFWTDMQHSTAPVKLEDARLYVDSLLVSGQSAAAADIWSKLVRTNAEHGIVQIEPGNLIYNGSFEQTPLGYGLDWRYQKVPYLAVDLASSPGYHGDHALELDFTVADNGNYEPLNQLVPVRPSTTYELSAMVRSEGVTSDSGPRLAVSQPGCADCAVVSTRGTTGTTPWHPDGVTFTTGPTTDLVRISVLRPRSRNYPADIIGKVWFDAISLKPTGSKTLAGKQ